MVRTDLRFGRYDYNIVAGGAIGGASNYRYLKIGKGLWTVLLMVDANPVYAASYSIDFQHEDSQDITQTFHIDSGFVNIHNGFPARIVELEGPGKFRATLKPSASCSTFTFASYTRRIKNQ